MQWRAIYTSPVIPTLQDIDWQSFVARPPLPSAQPETLAALARQTILITGAGGSIGTALAQRLATLNPPSLVVLEASESNLFALNSELAPSANIATFLGSAGDSALLEHIFATHRPRLVFHAAAFKHVPLMEQHPLAAIANNIFSTDALTRAAAAHHARVVLLSTDKAVQPASVMGATKRVAEQIVLSHGGTVLRLGNVLASRDSVTEIFAQQIARGGPVTVTDPAARRYFLTLDEAVDQILTAAANPQSPALLAPRLPATHYIADLANFMARTLSPGREISIEFTQFRPGDKETEQLWSEDDLTHPASPGASNSALISIQSESLSPEQITFRLAQLRAAVDARDLAAALAQLRALVPGYSPSESVLALARNAALQAPR
jgi:O-antigen biosynthesis protein WbqV